MRYMSNPKAMIKLKKMKNTEKNVIIYKILRAWFYFNLLTQALFEAISHLINEIRHQGTILNPFHYNKLFAFDLGIFDE